MTSNTVVENLARAQAGLLGELGLEWLELTRDQREGVMAVAQVLLRRPNATTRLVAKLAIVGISQVQLSLESIARQVAREQATASTES